MTNVANLDDRRRRAGAPAEPLAPAPQVDKYPTVIGQGLSLAYVSSAFRMCLAGYRQQYVDLLDELMEKDPHAYSVVAKRVLTVGGGRFRCAAPTGLEGDELAVAEDVAADAQAELERIPNFSEAMVLLAWATYYAVSSQEIVWALDEDDGRMHVSSLEFVHHRRLSFPDPWTWDVHIWDQGGMRLPSSMGAPTGQQQYGLRIADYPGKFIVHAPKVRGDYPTREGIGRQIAYWMTIKQIATRLAPQYLERYAIPWPDLSFNTAGSNPDAPTTPRTANEEDISGALTAAKAMGGGALSYYLHADSVKLQMLTPQGTPTLTFPEWVSLCDSQMSKATLGGTLSTDVGSTGGNRSLGDTQKQSEEKLYEFDARSLAATVKRDLVTWIVRMHYPGLPKRLEPVVSLHVNADPDPLDILARAEKGANAGMPIDADEIANRTDLPLVPNEGKTPRRMIPIRPVDIAITPETVGLAPVPVPAVMPAAVPVVAAPAAPESPMAPMMPAPAQEIDAEDLAARVALLLDATP